MINLPTADLLRKLALPTILCLAATLRFWHLGEAGFGTEYYAAAVRSMLTSGHALLFNAFDPAATLMVDKPPLALWAQVLSARLLGYNAFALMLPQAIEGTLSVLLLWCLVRRDFGPLAAALAALFLALTPVSVAVDRSNNTDSLLVLVLLAAACVLPRRDDQAAPLRLVLAMALVGVAFNVKMLAAFGVLPGFVAGYALAARAGWWRRIIHLAIGGAALVIVSASWISIVALTPAADRPFVDSSLDNSVFDLVLNHNALQRFVPRSTGRQQGGEFARRGAIRTPPAGPERLADPRLASQAIWLLPLALAGAIATIVMARAQAAWLWVGWAVSYGLVFSFAGGLFSPYYLVMLAPPLAALAGVGVVALARLWRATPRWPIWSVPAVLVASYAWQVNIMRLQIWDHAAGGLLVAAGVGVLLALCALAMSSRHAVGMVSAMAIAIGVAALLVTPAAWAIGTVRAEGGRPMARLEPPIARNRRSGAADDAILTILPFLTRNRGDATILAAVASARAAAPAIIATGAEIIAFGGFQGTMPVLDGPALARLAASGALRFVVLAQNPGRREMAPQSDALTWVRDHSTPVDPATVTQTRFEIYDLRPDLPMN